LLSGFFHFFALRRISVSIDRVQLEQRQGDRLRPLGVPIPGLSTQEVKLSNGQYSTTITAVGSGVSTCRGFDVSRWTPDTTCDSDGFHVYLRDLDDDFVWSAGFQPARVMPDAYEFQFSRSAAEIFRLDREIESQLTVCVAPEHNLELRRCRLANRGNRPRRIELTSYVEFVLGSRDADTSHPTFSKLFVETELRPAQ
jgi:cyclic beta-1,2-glucan synthetase